MPHRPSGCGWISEVAESWRSRPGLGLLLGPCGPRLGLGWAVGQDSCQQDVINHRPTLPWPEASTSHWAGTRGENLSFQAQQGKRGSFQVSFIFTTCFSQRREPAFGSTDCWFPKPTTDWFPVRHGGNLPAASPKTPLPRCKTSTWIKPAVSIHTELISWWLLLRSD